MADPAAFTITTGPLHEQQANYEPRAVRVSYPVQKRNAWGQLTTESEVWSYVTARERDVEHVWKGLNLILDAWKASHEELTGIVADLLADKEEAVQRIRESVIVEVLEIIKTHYSLSAVDYLLGAIHALVKSNRNPAMLPPDKIREQRDIYRRALDRIIDDYDRPNAWNESDLCRLSETYKIAQNAVYETENLA